MSDTHTHKPWWTTKMENTALIGEGKCGFVNYFLASPSSSFSLAPQWKSGGKCEVQADERLTELAAAMVVVVLMVLVIGTPLLHTPNPWKRPNKEISTRAQPCTYHFLLTLCGNPAETQLLNIHYKKNNNIKIFSKRCSDCGLPVSGEKWREQSDVATAQPAGQWGNFIYTPNSAPLLHTLQYCWRWAFFLMLLCYFSTSVQHNYCIIKWTSINKNICIRQQWGIVDHAGLATFMLQSHFVWSVARQLNLFSRFCFKVFKIYF